MAVLVATPMSASAEEQILGDFQLELGNTDNVTAFVTDIATAAGETVDVSNAEGDLNLQNNAVDAALAADSVSLQSVHGLNLNRDTGELSNAQLRNTVNVDINTLGEVAGNVGVNAASGAFNMQTNELVIAAVSGAVLAQSTASIRQESYQNSSVYHDVVNDITANINLDNVSGNVGINMASGVGNIQSNSLTVATPF